jgi:hypothetical protein
MDAKTNSPIIEPRPCKRYEVLRADGGLITWHRLPWRAIEARDRVNNHPGHAYGTVRAYACIGDKRVEINTMIGNVHNGNIFGQRRYIVNGVQCVLCCDNHYEPAESRDDAGRLTGWYEYVGEVVR